MAVKTSIAPVQQAAGRQSAERQPVLEARRLSVAYGQGSSGVRAVDSVDLTLRRGEFLGLAGESGSGKSTLAYGMTRLLPPPGVVIGGEVFYHHTDGAPRDVLTMTEPQLRRFRWNEVAIVFQSAMNALNPVLRIGTQLTDAIKAHRPDSNQAERSDRAAALLQMVQISADRLRSYPHQLSGGMRQRVMIAMALALEPEVIIMDEPTTALDVVVQRRILEHIAELRHRLGFAVIFITHDLSLLIEMADSIAIMYAGKLVEHAPAAQLYREPAHPYTYRLLHSFPPLRGPRQTVTGIPGSPPSLSNIPSGCAFHPRCEYAFGACRARTPVLEPRRGNAGNNQQVACWLHNPKVGPADMPTALATQSQSGEENFITDDDRRKP